jgi:hypothetical protein
MINVAMVNRSSALTDHTAQSTLAAFQAQLTEDVAPAWGLDAVSLSYVALHAKVPAGVWPIYLLNRSDEPGALGYHEDTGPVPDGKVFVRDAIRYGISWTVDFSHELIEMLVDPMTDRWVALAAMKGWKVIVEPGDPVEADSLGYKKQGVLVSDFVLPAYYGLAPAGGGFDYMNHLDKACPALLPGGYVSLQDPRGHIKQLTARLADGSMSRRAARTSRVYRPHQGTAAEVSAA